ncbi:MAG: lysophospholipid acyltransferase family protein [Methylococcaceae bacterium]|nr:lysophospholipid acyltransferase family protein [Methylococcaceae bacterium]
MFDPVFKSVLLYVEYRFFYSLASLLPVKFAYKAASIKGMLTGLFIKKTINDCIPSLEQCLGLSPEACKQIAKAQVRMLAREKMDVYLLAKMTRQNVDQYIKIEGLDHYLAAKKTNKPVILYTVHFGRLIMPAIALGLLGYETSPLTAPIHGAKQEQWYLDKKINAMRSIMKGSFVNTDQSMRVLYKILQNGETLIVLVDVSPVPGQACYEASFLGGTARFPKGIVKLAKKMDALLVPYFALEHQGYLSGEFLPAIATEGLQEQEILQLLLEPIEEKISQHPEQWWVWPWLSSFWRREG